MRRLLPISILASLLAIPASPSEGERSDGEGRLGDVPTLVELPRVSKVPAEQDLADVPTVRAAAPAVAASQRATADNDPSLISSPVLSEPLDTREAHGQLEAAVRGAKRDRAQATASPASSSPATTTPTTAVPAQLQAIAACESGGNPGAIGGGGAYRGKYQFSPATWQSVGGTGDPAAAPEAEQDRRAAMLYARSGASQWPVCGG